MNIYSKRKTAENEHAKLDCYYYLTVSSYRLRECPKAIEYARLGLEMSNKVHEGKPHVIQGHFLFYQAECYIQLDNYEQSERSALESIRVLTSAHGTEQVLEIGACYSTLGTSFVMRQMPKEGKPHLLKSVAILENVLKTRKYDTIAATYSNLGTVALAEDDDHMAEVYLTRSSKIWDAISHRQFSDIAFVFTQLSLAKQRLGKLREAKECSLKAIENWNRHHGTEENMMTLDAYKDLIGICYQLEDHDDVVRFQQKVTQMDPSDPGLPNQF